MSVQLQVRLVAPDHGLCRSTSFECAKHAGSQSLTGNIVNPPSPVSPPSPDVLTPVPAKFNVKDVCLVHNDTHMKNLKTQSLALPANFKVQDGHSQVVYRPRGDVRRNSAPADKDMTLCTSREPQRPGKRSQSVGPPPQDVLKAVKTPKLSARNWCPAHDDVKKDVLKYVSTPKVTVTNLCPAHDDVKKGVLKSVSTSKLTVRSLCPAHDDIKKDVLKAVSTPKFAARNLCPAHDDVKIKNFRPKADLRVLCYGDSNTAGFCSKGAKFEPYARSLEKTLLAAGIVCEVSHAGLSGLTAADMADKMDDSAIKDICRKEHPGLRKLIRELKPDLVIIMVGTNDIGLKAQPLQILQSVFRLHDVCHHDGIPTIAIAPPSGTQGPGRQCRDQFAMMLKQYATSNPHVATFRDAEELLPRGPLGYWEPDVIHLSPTGSQALGQQLGPIVMECKKMAGRPQHTWKPALGGA
mmetsp:Transcript_10874/g.20402  ORF Transcript_10874/g.20402 Transcript_10874/m.20402 type:complete len:465 (-) Transcript_10874:182-1576(-)